VQLGVVLVQSDQDLVGEPLVGGDQLGLHAVERGEVPGPAALQVDGVQVPVLVAATVLHVQQVAVVVRPAVVADAAIGVVGDRLGVVRADLADPDIEHAVHRCQPGDAGAVG
jgi:hypothetical protein